MSGRWDQSDPYDAWDEEDPEGPQACDFGDEDDETPTVPCPGCHRPIPDFADRCPYCGDWVVQTAGEPSRRNRWFVIVVIAVVGFVVMGGKKGEEAFVADEEVAEQETPEETPAEEVVTEEVPEDETI